MDSEPPLTTQHTLSSCKHPSSLPLSDTDVSPPCLSPREDETTRVGSFEKQEMVFCWPVGSGNCILRSDRTILSGVRRGRRAALVYEGSSGREEGGLKSNFMFRAGLRGDIPGPLGPRASDAGVESRTCKSRLLCRPTAFPRRFTAALVLWLAQDWKYKTQHDKKYSVPSRELRRPRFKGRHLE